MAMTPEQRKLAYNLISDPPPGSDLAAAKEYGIDLTLLVENLARTPTERALKLCETANSLQLLRRTGVTHRAKS